MKNFLELLDQLANSQPMRSLSLRLFKLEPGRVPRSQQPIPLRLEAASPNPTEGGGSWLPRQRRG